MEYNLRIWCEECTKAKRNLQFFNKWHIETFYSLSDAIQHYTQYGHEVKIDLEPKSEEE